MNVDFFRLAAEFAASVDEEDPLSILREIMDEQGKEVFSREFHAISLLDRKD